jgi:hypothetical protein
MRKNGARELIYVKQGRMDNQQEREINWEEKIEKDSVIKGITERKG